MARIAQTLAAAALVVALVARAAGQTAEFITNEDAPECLSATAPPVEPPTPFPIPEVPTNVPMAQRQRNPDPDKGANLGLKFVNCIGQSVTGALECESSVTGCNDLIDFTNADLSGASIRRCCFANSSFDLTTAMSGTDIGNSDDREQVLFEDCLIREVDWSGANIYANFTSNLPDETSLPYEAILSRVDFIGSVLQGSHFTRLKAMTDVNFTNAAMNHGMLIIGNIPEDVADDDGNTAKMPMVGNSFKGASASSAELKWITGESNIFSNASFDSSTWEFVDFRGSVFRNVDMHECSIGDSSFELMEFDGTDFSDCSLRNVEISGGTATETLWMNTGKFSCVEGFTKGCPSILAKNVDFTDSNFSNANVLKSTFNNCNMRNADFTKANVRAGDFTAADISGVDFTGALLYKAKFSQVRNLEEANFQDAELGDTEGLFNSSYKCTDFCAPFGCTCQVPTDAPSEEEAGVPSCINCNPVTCFPASASVLLADGSEKPMSHLQVGDRVQSANGETSQIFFFSHRLADGIFDFVKIGIEGDRQLVLSSSHYLYKSDGQLVAAGAVQTDDLLGSLEHPRRVTSVEVVREAGLYAPHSTSGELVVDSVRVSCYTTAVAPQLAHSLLTPLRALFQAGLRLPGFLDNTVPQWVANALPSGQGSTIQ